MRRWPRPADHEAPQHCALIKDKIQPNLLKCPKGQRVALMEEFAERWSGMYEKLDGMIGMFDKMGLKQCEANPWA